MHECGHNILFKRCGLNKFFGLWLIAAPLFLDINNYAKGHFVHHRYAGIDKDPDLDNYQNLPISRKNLLRKFWRNLSDQTGFRLTAAARKTLCNVMDSTSRDIDTLVSRANSTIHDGLIVNVCPLIVLTIVVKLWLYLLWVAGYFTFYMLFLRIRQIAEHGAVPELFNLDPRQNTRTTCARLF
ncbi:MAG: fatty acid desaturase [Candidatus Reddybacter sp.]